MNVRPQIAVAIVAVLAVAGGFAWVLWLSRPGMEVSAPQAAALPETMVDFVLPDVNGEKHRISEWRGKIIIINFWATWCQPCREEIPLLVSMQKKHGEQGLQIVGVALDKTSAVRSFADAGHINYPVLVGQEEVVDIMLQYGNRIASLPYSVIMDRQGRVLGRRIGAYQPPELEALLGGLFAGD